MKQQLFILGNPRSGTSLLRLLLNSHSLMCIPPECGFLLWLFPKYGNWRKSDLNTDFKIHFINDVLQAKKFETWGVTSEDLKRTIDSKSPSNYKELTQCVYLSYAFKYNKHPEVLGDKNNYYIQNLDDLDQLFENKVIVHLIRDGRDVAVSYRKIDDIPNTLKYKPKLVRGIEEIAKEWQVNNLNIYNRYKNDSNYVLIRYEDLIRETSKTLKKIVKKCDLVFENGMLNFHEDNLKNEIEPKATLAWKLKTTQPVDPENKGAYKEQLTQKEIHRFNSLAGETLISFGYEIEH